MSSPARRPGNRPSRRQREKQAYRLTLATGGFGLATAVVLILSILGVASVSLFVLLLVVTGVLGFLLSRAMR